MNKLPSLLGQMPSPPAPIYVVGDASALSLPCLAIVGTRRASAYGLRAAATFARALAESGFCIVSGLAYGVDAAAHRGALSVGGKTVAVLANSLDRIYPAAHRSLALEIVERGGCLVSEHPPGTPLMKFHFPSRNRIIAGLSLGTLVVEAPERSGALITARFAMEENREVFAIPGVFDDIGFTGNHRLIQEGAKLVTHPREVVEEILPGILPLDLPREVGELEKIFLENRGERTFEQILHNTGWAIADVKL